MTTLHQLLDALADAFDPLLALLALGAPLLRKPRALRPALSYYLATGLAIGVVYLVRALDLRYQLWGSLGLDYSTHSAFATALVVSMAAFHRQWTVPLFAALALYFCLILFMGYHGILDVLTSAPLAAAVAWLAHRGFAAKTFN
ncbi:MAG TPA: hypothetical protein VF017_08665 [Thermoanaerobaculia bacterium]|nr:hypothetical protein [Thermoanaerobaculia bacterium]